MRRKFGKQDLGPEPGIVWSAGSSQDPPEQSVCAMWSFDERGRRFSRIRRTSRDRRTGIDESGGKLRTVKAWVVADNTVVGHKVVWERYLSN